MHKYLLFILLLAAFISSPIHAQSNETGLHIVLLGDSNTSNGGDDCSRPRGWNKWFKDALRPASCISYARSGATWSNTEQTTCNTLEDTGTLSNDNVIYNQINRLLEAVGRGRHPRPDLIIINAGTNDAWFPEQRPGALDRFPEEAFANDSLAKMPASRMRTLAEAVRWNCERLKSEFPEAKILLLTPIQSTAISDSAICRAGDIIEETARRMGLPFIRLDRESPIRSEQERRQKRYTYDGTRTSEAGAQRIGALVAIRVKMLFTTTPAH